MRKPPTRLIAAALAVAACIIFAAHDVARAGDWGAFYWAHAMLTAKRAPAGIAPSTPSTPSTGAAPPATANPPATAVPSAAACDKAPPAFGVGEELIFNVMYGFVRAGTASLAVPEMTEVNGRKAYHLVSRARSSHTFSMFFEVNDKVDSWWDASCLRSLTLEKHLREGDYHNDTEIHFDYQAGLARYSSGKEIPLPGDVQDILSSLFCVRTLPLEVGSSSHMESHTDEKNYDLEVKVLSQETVNTPAGSFDCYVVEPMLQGAGIFRHSGRLQVWLTRDASHMPVLMKTKVPFVGSIVAELASYRLGTPAAVNSGGTGDAGDASGEARASSGRNR